MFPKNKKENRERTQRALRALKEYKDGPDYIIQDLLAALLPLCQLKKYAKLGTFEDYLRMARAHFEAEVNGDE